MCCNNSSCSFVEIERNKLITMCDKVITDVNKLRRHRDSEYLLNKQDDINRFRARWPFRLFLKQMTLEQVGKKERMKDDPWNTEYPSTYGCRFEEVAKRLLDAAKAADNCMVHVSTDDLKYLL
jgi:hypothetical protein